MKVISFEIEIKGFKTQITNTKELEAALKAVKQAGKDLDFGSDELEQFNKAQAELQVQQKRIRDEVKKNVKEIEAQENSYRGLSAQLVLARNAAKDLAVQYGRNSTEFKNAAQEVDKLDKELKEIDKSLGQHQRNVGNYPDTWQGAFQEITNLVPSFKSDIEGALGGVTDGLAKAVDLGVISDGVASGISKSIGGALSGVASLINPVTVGVGAIALGAGKIATEVAKVNEEFDKLNGIVKQVTGLTEDIEINFVTGNARGISEVFDAEFNEIVGAANNLVQNFDVTFDQAFDLIQTGFQSGANAQGDFLNQLREYPTVYRNIGFSAEEFIKIATQQVQDGIFDDKLLDTIKELDLSLKELTKTQSDALEQAFGEDFTQDFSSRIATGSLTTRDALLEITAQAQATGLDLQQTQVLTADLFKGAGEDAGGFANVVGSVFSALERDYDDLVDKTDDLVQSQNRALEAGVRLSTAQSELASVVGDLGKGVDTLGKEALAFLVEKLVDIITVGGQVIETIKENELAMGLFNVASSLVKGTFEVLGEVIGISVNVMQFFAEGIRDGSNAIVDFVRSSTLLSGIFAAIQQGLDFIAIGARNIPNVLNGVASVLQEVFRRVIAGIQTTALEAQILFNRVKGLVSKEARQIAKDLEGQKEAINGSGKTLSEAFSEGFNENRIKTPDLDSSEAVLQANGIGKAIGDNIRSSLESTGGTIGASVSKKIADQIEKDRKEQAKRQREAEREAIKAAKEFEENLTFNDVAARQYSDTIKGAEQNIKDLKTALSNTDLGSDTVITQINNEIERLQQNIDEARNKIDTTLITEDPTGDQEFSNLNEADDRLLENAELGEIAAEAPEVKQAADAAARRLEIEQQLQDDLATIRQQGADQMGDLFEGIASGALDSAEAIGDAMLDLVFDNLSSIIQANALAAISQAFATSPPFVAPIIAAASTGLIRGLLSQLRSVLFGEDGLSISPDGAIVAAKGVSINGPGNFENKGIAGGKSHSQGGNKGVILGNLVEWERGEFGDTAEDGTFNIINKKDTAANKPLLQSIHGKQFNGKKALMSSINSNNGISFMNLGGTLQRSIRRVTAPHRFAMEGISVGSAPIAVPASFEVETKFSDENIERLADVMASRVSAENAKATSESIEKTNRENNRYDNYFKNNTI